MTSICNFCFKLSNHCCYPNKTLKKYMELIFKNVELVMDDCFVICEECILKVNSAFEVKSVCICDEDFMVLISDLFPNELKICRFCINMVSDGSFVYLDKIDVNMDVGQIIKTHLPEVDFSIFNNPIVCNKCLEKLQSYGKLVDNLLEIFKLNYPRSNMVNFSDKNEVRDVLVNGDSVVDNNDTKDFNIDVHELKYSVESIKTEPASFDTQLENEDICRNDDSEVGVPKQRFKNVPFEYKIESSDYFLKEVKEISVYDVKHEDNANEYSYNQSTLHEENQETRQQKLDEYSSSLKQTYNANKNNFEIGVPTNTLPITKVENESEDFSEFNTLGEEQKVLAPIDELEHLEDIPEIISLKEIQDGLQTGFFTTNTLQKAEQPSYQQKVHGNDVYQIIDIDDEFMCSFCHFKSLSKELVELHFTNHNFHKFGLNYQSISNENDTLKQESFLKKSLTLHSNVQSKNPDEFESSILTQHNTLQKRNVNECSIKKCGGKIHSSKNEIPTEFIEYSNGRTILHEDESVPKRYKCIDDNHQKKNVSVFRKLSKTHCTAPFRFKCEHCNYRTNYQTSFGRHKILHRNPDEIELFKCDYCNFETKHKRSLKEHTKRHSDKCELHKCALCDYKSKYKRCLIAHFVLHSNNPVLYHCKYCDFRTKRLNSYNVHQIMHRTFEENDYFKCPHCDYKAKLKRYLNKHLKKHI